MACSQNGRDPARQFPIRNVYFLPATGEKKERRIPTLKILLDKRAGLITRSRDAQCRPCNIEGARLKEVSDWLEHAVGYLEKAVSLAPTDSRMQQRLGDAYGRSAQKASLLAKMETLLGKPPA